MNAIIRIAKTVSGIAPLLLAASAVAQVDPNQIHLGVPTYQGDGCPLGSVSALLSPDAQSLSIMFSALKVEAGGYSGRQVDRKQCNIAIPVQVPNGLSVSVIKIDYRGYRRLPLNASATFNVEYFFAGQNGPEYQKSFVGFQDGNFTLNNNVIATATAWSDCGADVNLRTSTSIAAQTNQFNEQTMLSIDSADLNAGVVYQLQWRTCGQGNYPQPNPYPAPNPYPQPQPYPYPQPQPYPQPVPQPQPYPTLGPCVINSYLDSRGFMVYMVKDGTGRILGNTVQYAEALRIAQQSQTMGFCNGVVNNTQTAPQPNPYPAPNPYPQPQPYPQPVPQPVPQYGQCQVVQGRNAYGQILFRVVDRHGRILVNTTSMYEAQRISQTDSRCFR